MCGIAVLATSQAMRYEAALHKMSQSLAHRGPDGHGMVKYAQCLLAHRRLSIVDLEDGAQPMTSCDGALSVAFNGELYNYKIARSEIAYPYRTQSDTEVLLAAYANYGEAMCRYLSGMFAFALWDEKERKLICARDRFGEKPLYYSLLADGTLIVASEIKAILASGLMNNVLDQAALAAFLQLRYVPEKLTMFKGIRQLEPGHCLCWQDGKIEIKRYWDFSKPDSCLLSEAEAAEEFNFRLGNAVKDCLAADVEVGILLSGGLDSTTIAALACEQRDHSPAFAFGMAGAKNELPYARAAARYYDLPLTELYEEDMDIRDLLLQMPDIYDEPLADTSCLPTIMLFRHVSKYVKAVVGGDGGDELLGGYNWYKKLPQLASGQSVAPGQWSNYAYAHYLNRMACPDSEIIAAGLTPYSLPLPAYLNNSIEDALRLDAISFLPSDILRKTDRAAMSCGLEIRSPFLSVEVAELLLALPPSMKFDDQGGKKLLRLAFGHLWPEEIRNRGKQGFGMVAGNILRNPALKDFLTAYLMDSNLVMRNILPPEWIDKHVRTINGLTWNLLVLSIWCEHIKAHNNSSQI